MKAPHSNLRRLYANNTHAQRCVRVENQSEKRIDITEEFQIVVVAGNEFSRAGRVLL